MTRETNKQSWDDPENWSHGIGGIYFSRSDNRLFVSKRNPLMGWTINMAHRHAIWCLLLFAVVPAILVAIALAAYETGARNGNTIDNAHVFVATGF